MEFEINVVEVILRVAGDGGSDRGGVGHADGVKDGGIVRDETGRQIGAASVAGTLDAVRVKRSGWFYCDRD
jgi:hypothetical protein